MPSNAPRVAVFDESACPVSDATLSRLYRAEAAEIQAIAMDLPELHRIQLAVFSFSRSHLREVGQQVAAVCNPDTLLNAEMFGRAAVEAVLDLVMEVEPEENKLIEGARDHQRRIIANLAVQSASEPIAKGLLNDTESNASDLKFFKEGPKPAKRRAKKK